MDANEAFEQEAELFYKDTGFLAPGKSESPAACGQTDFERYEVRQLLKRAWDAGRRRPEPPRREAEQEAYTHTLDLLARNVKIGYPTVADSGECYLCGKGQPRVHEDGEAWCFDDDIDHLESPKGHKDDCAWKLAMDWLDKVGYATPAKGKEKTP
jgi:hypothetical protein